MEIIVRNALPVDAEAVARVHIQCWQETYQGIVADTYLNNLSFEKRVKMWRHYFSEETKDSVSLVAETSDEEIIGFVNGGLARDEVVFKVELYAIYLLRGYQGEGLGKRLLSDFRDELSRTGHNSFYLWVLEDNPYRGFYTHMGGRELQKRTIEIGEQVLPEVMIGFS